MSEGSPDFRSSLRRVLGKAEGENHPPLETLEAFHWGDLPTDRADQVRAHLSGCARCLDLLAELDEIEATAAAAEVEVPPGELERSLGQVQERLRAETAFTGEGAGEDSPASAHPPAPRARFFPRWSTAPGPYVLTAASLVAGIGLSLWLASRLELERQRLPELESRLAAVTARTTAAEEELEGARQQALTLKQQADALRRERDQLLAPQPNTPIVDLWASGERDGGAGQVTEIRLPSGVRFLTLVLEDLGDDAYPANRARLLDQSGNQVLTVEGLERTVYRSFVVTFARDSLPAEEVRVLLEGRSARRWIALAEYRLRIRE